MLLMYSRKARFVFCVVIVIVVYMIWVMVGCGFHPLLPVSRTGTPSPLIPLPSREMGKVVCVVLLTCVTPPPCGYCLEASMTGHPFIRPMDSRLRGNDGEGRGSDGEGRGSDGEGRGSDGERLICLIHLLIPCQALGHPHL